MAIPSIDQQSYEAARERQGQLALPARALGDLGTMACWFAARQGKVVPDALQPHVTIFAADHGVVAEGVSSQSPDMTVAMVRGMAAGNAAINVLARQCGAGVTIVDVGVAADLAGMSGIEHAKVRRGSGNIVQEAAMTQDEYWQAVGIGEEMANRAIDGGANLLIAGDVGVGNSTPSAALICELSGLDVEAVIGPRGELEEEEIYIKQALVKQAIIRARGTPSTDLLRELGGLEIAAMAGFYRAAASRGVPVLLDGFTSAAAAMAATAWDVHITGWLLASHVSEEPGHERALAELGLEPLVDFKLQIGEGTGATLVVPILNTALALHREVALRG